MISNALWQKIYCANNNLSGFDIKLSWELAQAWGLNEFLDDIVVRIVGPPLSIAVDCKTSAAVQFSHFVLGVCSTSSVFHWCVLLPTCMQNLINQARQIYGVICAISNATPCCCFCATTSMGIVWTRISDWNELHY